MMDRENPTCVRWGVEGQPVAAAEVVGVGADVIVRGGHVGLSEQTSEVCRHRSDFREKRMRPEGSADSQNLATSKGTGFRCARDLTTEEWTTFAADPRFGHLNEGSEEVVTITQPSFVAEGEPPVDLDATEAPAGDGANWGMDAEVGPTEQ